MILQKIWQYGLIPASEVDEEQQKVIHHFVQTIVDKLKVKEMYFAGPEFHIIR